MNIKNALITFVSIVALLAAVIYLVSSNLPNDGDQALTPLSANTTAARSDQASAKPDEKQIDERYGKIPIHFEPNVGQTDAAVRYLARGRGYSLFLTGNEAVLSLEKRGNRSIEKRSVLKMSLDGANADPASLGQGETAARSNYFIGNDPRQWRTDVPHFERVRYESVYEGIDLVYYGNGQQLEYDFVVQPGADPGRIALRFSGAESIELEKVTGDLLLETGTGTIRQHKPIVYQDIDGVRTEIASAYRVDKYDPAGEPSGYAVTFGIAEYDRTRPLIIDPILAYGSYLGGNMFDQGGSVAVDSSGNAVIVGTASSRDFPTTPGTIKPQMLPSTSGSQYWYDAFVTKMNADGTGVIFSTYYGGRNGSETGTGVAVDAAGNVLISGTTMASDLPTVNAYQSSFGGTDDAFAAKLNPTGSAIIYSTYFGGNNTDLGGKVALNENTGDAVFAGYASSPNFPTTPGAFKEKLCDSPQTCSGVFYSGSYLVKLTANGNAVYSTLFTVGINDVAVDAADNAVIGGSAGAGAPTTPGAFQPATSGGTDGYLAKMNPAGSAVVFGTYLGGGLQSDRIMSVVLDEDQNMYVTGRTENSGFPTTSGALDQTFNGAEDGFVTKFNPEGTGLVYSTFLGGTGNDEPFGIAINTAGDAFITGETTNPSSFPLKNSLNGTAGTIFVTNLNAAGSALIYSTMLGVGGGYDIAVDAGSSAYVTGHTLGILVTPNAFQTIRNNNPENISDKDAYIVKLAPSDEGSTFYSISGVVTDENYGFDSTYSQIMVTLTGGVNRVVALPYNGGQYSFGVLPAGQSYTVTVRKIGYVTDPESVTFNNLGANQSANFTILRNHHPESTITSPEHGSTFNAGAPISIQAVASDPDGDPIQKVEFLAYKSGVGTVPLGIDTEAPYEFTWNGATVGTWALYAQPYDNHGLAGSTQNIVHVFVVDPSPVTVSLESPTEGQVFQTGQYVPIATFVSSSVNLVEVRDQNDTLVGRMTGSPWTTQWRVMEPGNYTLTATASNSQGQTAASAPVNIVVNDYDHRISGRITDSLTGTAVANITLNLTCTTNPSISAVTTTDSTGNYQFVGLGATPNDSIKIVPTLADHTFSPVERAIGYLGYIDWPNQNFSAIADNPITVAMTSPTGGQTFPAGSSVVLAADASTSVGTITQVEFYKYAAGGQHMLLDTDTEAPYEFTWENVPGGSNSVFAKAINSEGTFNISSNVGFTVQTPPSVIRLQGDISNPGGGAMQGIIVRLTGTVNGSPVNQTSVSNFFGAYGFFNLTPGGDYTISPESSTLTFTPPSVTITNAIADNYDIDFVSSAINQAPAVQINSPSDGGTYNMPDAIPVNVSATDVDGQVTHLTVSAVGNSMSITIGQSNNGTFSAPWQPNAPGSYRIWATARDNGGLQTSTFIDISVTPPSPVSISGRVVTRDSEGIEGVTMELRNYPQEDTVVATTVTDSTGSYSFENVQTFASYSLRPEMLNYTITPHRRTFFNLATTQTGIDFTGTQQVQLADFDGDGGSDFAIWRPSNGVWHITASVDHGYISLHFGGGEFGDIVVPGNYDGDKRTDYAVYRGGIWYVRKSSTGAVSQYYFGLADDTPISGDFDGDGTTDIAVWRNSDGTWHILRSSDGGYSTFHFGSTGDKPLAGDYDGDGISDATIWRPENGNFYILKSSDGQARIEHFGMMGDMPFVGDFDGDKLTDLAVFRPSNGAWYYITSSDSIFRYRQWGVETDKIVPGDYDRDGKTDFAIFRPSTGDWWVLNSGDGSYTVIHFGQDGDIPVPAAFIR